MEQENEKLIDSIVYEYLLRKEKNAAMIFQHNRGPVCFINSVKLKFIIYLLFLFSFRLV